MAPGTMPGCMGITTAATATTFAATNIAGHAMVSIPGGLTVIGSGKFEDAVPRWVQLSPYAIGETAVSESQYREVIGRPWDGRAAADHPVTQVSWNDAQSYVQKRGGRLALPTEAQWEHAARGPAVNMREQMEAEMGRFMPWDFVDFAEGRYENLVFGALGQIFTDPKGELFQHMMNQDLPFFGWRAYSTPSGRLTHEETWYDQKGTAPVTWGSKGPSGTLGMTGGVWEWVEDVYTNTPKGSIDPLVSTGSDRVLRGGSWNLGNPGYLRAAYRNGSRQNNRGGSLGFRVAAPLGSGK